METQSAKPSIGKTLQNEQPVFFNNKLQGRKGGDGGTYEIKDT